jgi:hypothetical protein
MQSGQNDAMDDDNPKRPATRFYYPPSYRYGDGTLVMPVSTYSDTISTGCAMIRPDSPDFELWLWFLPRFPALGKSFISGEYLESLRPEFEQERMQTGSETLFRARLLNAIPVLPEPTLRERILDKVASCGEFLLLLPFFGMILVLQAFVKMFDNVRGWGRGRRTDKPE